MFILQEIQAQDDGIHAAFLPPETRETRSEIESVFYQKCAFACVSDIPIHTIMVYTEEGFVVSDLTRCFKHFE